MNYELVIAGTTNKYEGTKAYSNAGTQAKMDESAKGFVLIEKWKLDPIFITNKKEKKSSKEDHL